MLQDFITLLRRVHRFKTYKLFIPGIFYLLFLTVVDHGYPLGLHEAPENKTADKREILYGYIQKLG